MKILAFILNLVCCYFLVEAQNEQTKSYETERVEGEAPVIDGVLDDPAWELVSWGGGDFVQVSPYAAAQPTFQTTFKILYDDKYLYVAIKNYDSESDKIAKRMSRRDGFDGDYVELDIDSYYDKRTAFSFTSSVSGVKSDGYIFNNGYNVDYNWDPIWYLRTSIDEDGWIAEIKIPLSQLRFSNKKDHTWGLQISRRFFRNQERSSWQFIPPDAGGWVHLMGELKGIRGIRPQNQLEIQPYLVAKTERFQAEEGNPFLTGKSSDLNYGLDAKIGITSDVTLDLTV
ncbi:MAG TPA: carbohydrate binding family 9 domain-containing protein, partial [Cellvibrio sp.]